MCWARHVWILAFVASSLFAQDAFNADQLAMLHDPHGWEYVSVFDLNNGMQEQHACFVQGQTTDACRGTLKLGKDGKFVQNVYIHGQNVARHGTYELDGNQITLEDELGTADGPYILEIKTEPESMRMSMDRGGVLIGADLKLVDSSRENKKKKKQSGKQGS